MRIWPLRWADFPKHSSKTTWPCQLSLLEDQRGVGKVAAGGDTGKLISKQGHSRSACLFLQSSLINTLSEQIEKTTGCGFIASLYFHSTVLIMTSFSHCTHVFVPNDNLSNWCIMKSLPYANRFICALQACLTEGIARAQNVMLLMQISLNHHAKDMDEQQKADYTAKSVAYIYFLHIMVIWYLCT